VASRPSRPLPVDEEHHNRNYGVATETVIPVIPVIPDTPKPVYGMCPPGGCPGVPRERVDRMVAQAYSNGWADSRAWMIRTSACWTPHARKSHEQWVAERLASWPAPRELVYGDPNWPAVAVPGEPGVRR
jgi:hypothetical protein